MGYDALQDWITSYNQARPNIHNTTPLASTHRREYAEMRCLGCGNEDWAKSGDISYRCSPCRRSRYTLGLSRIVKQFI
ncbi:hypothetical protein ITP53_25955 [Nonomuraea sp. K274]|uniref:Uncharacterized protein n=1 Tax=Nonomuraea cypriaca TaxID=1187855 RepID=A0A931AFE1_9ACTN|nr:hypothetical protein [Nonomuraea cypriaca]MBF8189115.1 hypothetical protein [Nonomuraea cypriaca]